MKNKRVLAALLAASCLATSFTACSGDSSSSSTAESSAASADASSSAAEGSSESTGLMSDEEIIKKASSENKVGNWGLGNEYEIQALLSKYGLPTDYITMDFTMDQIDKDTITLASAMTFNELGLIKNNYDGGYNYGDEIGVTYACEHPDEAAEIVFKYGSSVSADHQKYMASEVAKLVTTDTKGNAVSASDVGKMDEDAMQQTLDLAKQYIKLDDATAADKLAKLTLDDIRSSDYLTYDGGAVEKSDLKVQLKWLPQAQFMGYYVALDKGYYKDNGLNVEIVSGGGDVSETVAVSNGTVDFGVTWVSNLINANAGGMELLEVAQVYQRSGLVLCYKKSRFTK